MTQLKIIGLTGGIASGKSTVAQFLSEKGYCVIEADKMGHKILEPGQKAYLQVIQQFGDVIVNNDKSINRVALGQIVFSDSKKLEQLNQITHPLIADLILNEVASLEGTCLGGVIFLEAALLIEAEWHKICQQVWVVMLDRETALDRLQNRNGLSRSEALARFESQMNPEDRLKYADVVLQNDGDVERLTPQVNSALEGLE